MAGDNDEEFSRGDFTVSGRRALTPPPHHPSPSSLPSHKSYFTAYMTETGQSQDPKIPLENEVFYSKIFSLSIPLITEPETVAERKANNINNKETLM